MWYKAFVATCFILSFSFVVQAQHEEHTEVEVSDSSAMFGKILNTGKFEFHLRSYFMHTNNADGLLDYSAWGTGAGLGYFSPRWKGLGVGFSGFFVFRHLERNLTVADPKTGLGNRYELTLFDLHHPENKKDMDRLEEFFVSYEDEKFSAWFGRHHFESPLLNASDNRLRPNLFSGFSGTYATSHFKMSGAWFSRLISRGSLEWSSVGESLGFYSPGRNPDGSTESYKHHISSKGIAVLGVEYKAALLEAQSWNYVAEGIFATNFSELKGSIPIDSNKQLLYGVQGFYQQAVGNGEIMILPRPICYPKKRRTAWVCNRVCGGRIAS